MVSKAMIVCVCLAVMACMLQEVTSQYDSWGGDRWGRRDSWRSGSRWGRDWDRRDRWGGDRWGGDRWGRGGGSGWDRPGRY